MGRGLDGYFLWFPLLAGCAVLKARAGSDRFPVALARGKHLFPFRTEQLSPSAPMVLGSQGPGRVGRRRFFLSAKTAADRAVVRRARPRGRLSATRARVAPAPRRAARGTRARWAA